VYRHKYKKNRDGQMILFYVFYERWLSDLFIHNVRSFIWYRENIIQNSKILWHPIKIDAAKQVR